MKHNSAKKPNTAFVRMYPFRVLGSKQPEKFQKRYSVIVEFTRGLVQLIRCTSEGFGGNGRTQSTVPITTTRWRVDNTAILTRHETLRITRQGVQFRAVNAANGVTLATRVHPMNEVYAASEVPQSNTACFAIIGRLCGDEEDTCRVYPHTSQEAAIDSFYCESLRAIGIKYDPATYDSEKYADGPGAVFINQVLRSDTHISEC